MLAGEAQRAAGARAREIEFRALELASAAETSTPCRQDKLQIALADGAAAIGYGVERPDSFIVIRQWAEHDVLPHVVQQSECGSALMAELDLDRAAGHVCTTRVHLPLPVDEGFGYRPGASQIENAREAAFLNRRNERMIGNAENSHNADRRTI